MRSSLLSLLSLLLLIPASISWAEDEVAAAPSSQPTESQTPSASKPREPTPLSQLPTTREELLTFAEEAFAEQSFADASRAYAALLENFVTTSVEERLRWRIRQEDARWRSLSRDELAAEDGSRLKALLLEARTPDGQLTANGALIQQALGDFHSDYPNYSSEKAWEHYQAALAYWAASRDLETARAHYLEIVLQAVSKHQHKVPTRILENAVRISNTPVTKAWTRHQLAQRLSEDRSRPVRILRAGDLLREAVEIDQERPRAPVYHLAYAQWLQTHGRSFYADDGDLKLAPDFARALEEYRKIVTLYPDTPQSRTARNRIDDITDEDLDLAIPSTFRPGTEPQFVVSWRNLESVEVQITRVNLLSDLAPLEITNEDYLTVLANSVAQAGEEARAAAQVYNVTLNRPAPHPHAALREVVRIPVELPAGAYLVEARSGEKRQRDLLLVTDLALLVKTSPTQVVAYLCDAITGAPIEEGEVVLWKEDTSWPEDEQLPWTRQRATTEEDGLVTFAREQVSHRYSHLLIGSVEGRFAVARSNDYNRFHRSRRQDSDRVDYRSYLWTDRPAYRPGETVHWKAMIRIKEDGRYLTPEPGMEVRYLIGDEDDPFSEGVLKTNDFGTIWGSFELPESSELDPEQFGRVEAAMGISGHDSLNLMYNWHAFHLEEYRLPEFTASVRLLDSTVEDPETETPAPALLHGDDLEGVVEVKFFHGAPLPDAEVELRLQREEYQRWIPWRFNDQETEESLGFDPRISSGEPETLEVLTLKTDSRGLARFSFPTPITTEVDYSYTIEARVTGPSRREETTWLNVMVTRQSYYAQLEPARRVLLPGERAEITVRTVNASDQPVSERGSLRVTRERWEEVYVDRRGREISGEELRELKRRSGGWFYFGPEAGDYTLKSEGYVTEEITLTELRTNTRGEATFSFQTPDRGFYRFTWISRGQRGQPVKADTAIWVSPQGQADISYRPDGVQIIVDRDSVRVGEKAPVMLTVPASNRYVLFTMGAEEMQSIELLHFEETSRLLMLDIGPEHIPNTFLEAHMIADEQVYRDSEELEVPPEHQIINLTLTPDAEGYEPRDTATWILQASRLPGEPIEAELSFGLVNEALYAIYQDDNDPVGDYYGSRNQNEIEDTSSFRWKPFFRPLDEEEETGETLGSIDDGRWGDRLPGYTISTEKLSRSSTVQSAEVHQSAEFKEQRSPQILLREDFRTTAHWTPAIVTDANGQATLETTFDDSLAGWQATAVAVGKTGEVGLGTAQVATRLPLIARLQHPRFMIEGDEAILAGLFQNNTERSLRLNATLELGPEATPLGWHDAEGQLQTGPAESLLIPPGEVSRIDWRVRADAAGTLNATLTALTDSHGDAIQRTVPIHRHGFPLVIGRAGRLSNHRVDLTFDLPAEREEAETTLQLRLAPGLSGVMLEALPYLAEFPYACAEQTASRFVPALATRAVLEDLGFDKSRIQDRLDALASLTPKPPETLTLDGMAEAGITRLRSMQNSSGAFSWLPGGRDDAYMTSYLLWALAWASQSGLDIPEDLLEPSRKWLLRELVEGSYNHDRRAWMFFALATSRTAALNRDIPRQRRPHRLTEVRPTRLEARVMVDLLRERAELSPRGLALLCLAAQQYGFADEAELLLRNLRNGIQREVARTDGVLYGDDPPAWAWWPSSSYDASAAETTALALIAHVKVDPRNPLVQESLNWLLSMRQGARWSHTRETALVLAALEAALRQLGDLEESVRYEIFLNGEMVQDITFTPEETLPKILTLDLPTSRLRAGQNKVRLLRTSGDTPILYSLEMKTFSRETPLPPTRGEVSLQRSYEILREYPTLLEGFSEDRTAVGDQGEVLSGERADVFLRVESPIPLNYILLEDNRAGAFEPLTQSSGEWIEGVRLDAPGSLRAQMVIRDRQIGLLIPELPAGRWEFRYRLRAESPGWFHTLPARVEPMYQPAMRATSAELRFNLEDSAR